MVESEATTAAPPAATLKKAKTTKPKKPKTAPSHPKVSDMVNTAISTLKERGGSSLQAIKKYVGGHYKVDVEKLSPFIKKYLKNAVASGILVQTKGKGASGSFRMTSGGAKEKSTKPKPVKVTKKVTKPAVKKTAKPKTPKKTAVKKAPKPKLAKSPKKSKTLKPKAPKPKKAKAVKKAAPKKK